VGASALPARGAWRVRALSEPGQWQAGQLRVPQVLAAVVDVQGERLRLWGTRTSRSPGTASEG